MTDAVSGSGVVVGFGVVVGLGVVGVVVGTGVVGVVVGVVGVVVGVVGVVVGVVGVVVGVVGGGVGGSHLHSNESLPSPLSISCTLCKRGYFPPPQRFLKSSFSSDQTIPPESPIFLRKANYWLKFKGLKGLSIIKQILPYFTGKAVNIVETNPYLLIVGIGSVIVGVIFSDPFIRVLLLHLTNL